MTRSETWLGKPLTQSATSAGNYQWRSGTSSLTISECDGWWVAQAATDGFIEISSRKRTDREARAEVEKRLSAIADGVRELSLQLSSAAEPVDRRATVAEGETRLAMLDRLLREIVEAVDEFEADQIDDCSITWRRVLDGIEAARYAIGANS